MTNPTLPVYARLPINRCKVPPVILGSLTFQQHPVALQLDGIAELHTALFNSLDSINDAKARAENFKSYMRSSFLLDHLDEAGFEPSRKKHQREKADYLRMLRGWLFNPDGMEGAVLKSWVESRFGLLPRNHHGPLGDFNNEAYQVYLRDRTQGLYNTNALESQLDLLFTYCQYEIQRRYPDKQHIILYRGTNRIDEYEILEHPDKRTYILILNNLNSFTDNQERADEFGDYILEAKIPVAKILFMPELFADTLKGENEYLVIGGVYEVNVKPP